MPEGYAARVYTHMRSIADSARAEGATTLTIRVRDVVDALEEQSPSAALDVKQVLTTTFKLTAETGLLLQEYTGSGQRLDSTFTFTITSPRPALQTAAAPKAEPPIHTVTGATGYTGRYITRLLIDRGDTVRTLTGHPDRPNPFGTGVQMLPFNFDNPDALARSLEGTHTLFNTYWVRVPRRRPHPRPRRLQPSHPLHRRPRTAGVQRIVHVSITNADPNSPLSYFRCKGLAEDFLRQTQAIPYAILRPTLVFGREDILLNNIAWMLRRFPVFLVPGSGRYQVQPVCVEDLARLAVEAANARDNTELDAVGPDSLRLRRNGAPHTPEDPH